MRGLPTTGSAANGTAFASRREASSDDPMGVSRAMINGSPPADPAGKPSTSTGRARTDLDPDESNIFGPDAPNTREDDPSGGQYATEAPPPEPSKVPLDHGDFAPDEA
jgi:hypothetical protein